MMQNVTDQLLETTKGLVREFADILPEDEFNGRVKDVWEIINGKILLNKLQHLSKCESPIEKIMCLCLWEQVEPFKTMYEIHLTPQWAIWIEDKDYRVDFYIEAWAKKWPYKVLKLVLECDGHNYHERTAAQAKRDKERDRKFTRNGYQVLRYTGAEITADPFKCAQDVFGTIRKLLRDDSQKEGA